MILNTTDTLQKIADTIEDHGSCFFTRFGDGDIIIMAGQSPSGDIDEDYHTCNGTYFNPALQHEMKQAFAIDDNVFLKGCVGHWEQEPGMVDGVFKSFKISTFLEEQIATLTAQRDFLSPVVFQYLAVFKPKILKEFISFIYGDIAFISGTPKEWGENVLGRIGEYITCPFRNSYESIDLWYEVPDSPVVIVNCGEATKAVMLRLYNDGYKGIALDMGSLFDAWGPPTRTWLRLKGKAVRENFANTLTV